MCLQSINSQRKDCLRWCNKSKPVPRARQDSSLIAQIGGDASIVLHANGFNRSSRKEEIMWWLLSFFLRFYNIFFLLLLSFGRWHFSWCSPHKHTHRWLRIPVVRTNESQGMDTIKMAAHCRDPNGLLSPSGQHGVVQKGQAVPPTRGCVI